MVKWFKVGGMRFLRIGKLQFSFCVCSGKPKRPKTKKPSYAQAWKAGWYAAYENETQSLRMN